MTTYKRKAAAPRYAVAAARLHVERQRVWDIVVNTQGSWQRYQRSQLYDTVEIRRAFRNDVVFGLRRFGDEVEALLRYLACEVDRARPERGPLTGGLRPLPHDPGGLITEMSVVAAGVRPRVIPPGLRHTLTRALAQRDRRPEEFADDELRVLAVGLWGLWDACDDGLREFEAWLQRMAER